MKESSTFDKDFWKYFGCFIGIVLIICLLPWILTRNSLLDFTETGQIGDTIGGIIGPFVAIAAAGLTFIAFWVQYKANILQRHDISKERFESNLFEMIHVQQEIINGLKIDGAEVFHRSVSVSGRDVFLFVYEDMPITINSLTDPQVTTLKLALGKDIDIRHQLSSIDELWFLDHYFRHLYRVFKYIDEAGKVLFDDDKKEDYAAIVRATLSPYELIMIYYNGFSHPKFKHLIEKFHLLNNLRCNLLAHPQEKRIVREFFSADNSITSDSHDVLQYYSRSAFVKD